MSIKILIQILQRLFIKIKKQIIALFLKKKQSSLPLPKIDVLTNQMSQTYSSMISELKNQQNKLAGTIYEVIEKFNTEYGVVIGRIIEYPSFICSNCKNKVNAPVNIIGISFINIDDLLIEVKRKFKNVA